MGSSSGGKSNTGIKALDDVSQGASNWFNSATTKAGDFARETSYAFSKGDFNNYGNTWGNAVGSLFTAGLTSPNMQTGMQRKEAEANAQADQAAKDQAIADVQRKNNNIANILEGSSRQRMVAPGIGATLISQGAAGTQGSSTNTLLTIRGNNGR